MKKTTLLYISKLHIILVFLNFSSINAQNYKEDIINSYIDYASAPREVVYVHLNKSTYIKGEDIGFTAYVLDKNSKKPSLNTTNLYVSIENEKKESIKKVLLKIENGIASNVFTLDSTFTSGNYTFKAYTNWMRNFNEQNYFAESIQIIDPNKEKHIENTLVKNDIDAQFLPEGGHLLNGVVNKVGVILKDTKGYGISSAKGIITDQDDNIITEFKVNKLGIGSFLLLAELGKNYKINVNDVNKNYIFDFNHKIEKIGVTLSVSQHRDKAFISLNTNQKTLNLIKGKNYKLALHNGTKISTLDLFFNKEINLVKAFDLKKMSPGINILTLFNENNQPIIERLFFNYNGIDLLKSNSLSASRVNDSVNIKLNFKNIDPQLYNNLSISVLPKETKSYKAHYNMLSYVYLKPYVKGYIEQAKHYFVDINEEKKIELDNLLITQGWSSYDWKNIFKPVNSPSYEFEQGITLKANINGEDQSVKATYMLQKKSSDEHHFFEVSRTDKNYFYIDSLFPNETERIYLSKFVDKEFLPTQFYIQASPQEIPNLYTTNKTLLPKSNYAIEAYLNKNVSPFQGLNKVQELDEVLINADLDDKRLRIEKLSKYPVDRVLLVDEDTSRKYLFLSDLIIKNGGFNVYEDNANGMLIFLKKFSNGETIDLDDGTQVYIDDLFISSRKEIFKFPSYLIDYIMFKTSLGLNKSSIRIYTKENSKFMDKGYNKQEFKFPLTFSERKEFYVPKYRYYNDDFFKEYGTIDWKPNLTLDSNGDVTIKIAKPEVPITLFIEGIANDGSFIYEEKSLIQNGTE